METGSGILRNQSGVSSKDPPALAGWGQWWQRGATYGTGRDHRLRECACGIAAINTCPQRDRAVAERVSIDDIAKHCTNTRECILPHHTKTKINPEQDQTWH